MGAIAKSFGIFAGKFSRRVFEVTSSDWRCLSSCLKRCIVFRKVSQMRHLQKHIENTLFTIGRGCLKLSQRCLTVALQKRAHYQVLNPFRLQERLVTVTRCGFNVHLEMPVARSRVSGRTVLKRETPPGKSFYIMQNWKFFRGRRQEQAPRHGPVGWKP